MRLTHLTLAVATLFVDHVVASTPALCTEVVTLTADALTETVTSYQYTSWITQLPNTIYTTVSCNSNTSSISSGPWIAAASGSTLQLSSLITSSIVPLGLTTSSLLTSTASSSWTSSLLSSTPGSSFASSSSSSLSLATPSTGFVSSLRSSSISSTASVSLSTSFPITPSSTSFRPSSTLSSTTSSSTTSAASCAVPNPLINGGFEAGFLSPWTSGGNSPGWSANIITPGLNSSNAIQVTTPSAAQGGLCLIVQTMSNLCVGSLYTVTMSYQISQADPNNEIVLRTCATDSSHLLDLYDQTNPPAGTWIHVAKTFTPTLETMQLAIIFLGPSSKVYEVDDIQFTLGDSTAAYTSAWNALPTPTSTAYSITTNPPMSTQTMASSSLSSSSTTSSALPCNTAPVVVSNGGFESGSVAPWIVRGDSLRCACNTISPGFQSSGALSCLVPAYGLPSSAYTVLDQVMPNACAGVNYTVSAQVQTSLYNAQFSEIILQVWDTGYLHYQVPFDVMLPPSAVNNWFSVSGNFTSTGNGLILRFIMLGDLVDTYYTIDNIVLSVAGSTPPLASSSIAPTVSSSSKLSFTTSTISSTSTTSSSITATTSTLKSSTTSSTAPPSTSTSSAPALPTWPPIPGVCPIQFFQVATFDLPSSPYAFSDPSSPSLSVLNPSSDPQNSWGIVSPGFLSEYAFAAYNVRSPTGSPYSGTTLATEIDTCPGVAYTISVNFKFINREPNTYINIFVDGQYVISDRADGTAVSSYPVPANEPGWYFAKGSFTATKWSTDLVISFLCTAGDTETILFDNLVIEPQVPAPW